MMDKRDFTKEGNHKIRSHNCIDRLLRPQSLFHSRLNTSTILTVRQESPLRSPLRFDQATFKMTNPTQSILLLSRHPQKQKYHLQEGNQETIMQQQISAHIKLSNVYLLKNKKKQLQETINSSSSVSLPAEPGPARVEIIDLKGLLLRRTGSRRIHSRIHVLVHSSRPDVNQLGAGRVRSPLH